MKTIRRFLLMCAALAMSASAWAQSADTVLINGKVLTVDPKSTVAQAIAIREGKIAAVGTTAEIRNLAGPGTRTIDLQGRTVIPGLIDSHLHGIRAGLSFATEVYWVGATSLVKVWQQREMTARVAYALNGQVGGKEFDEFKDLTQLLPMGFGDEWLRFNGLGERLTFAMYNNDRPSEVDKAPFYDILKWAAGRGMSVTVHWTRDESVNELLTLFERLNKEVGITKLHWSIAHLSNASEASLARMKALGVGWASQPNRVVPPVGAAKQMGVVVGAGTDAHRVASYNPFTALQGFLEGNSPVTRADALMFYTQGSAWFSFDEARRGSLEVGKLADLAVLSKDYMTVPVAEIGSIESVLTMVGGKIVYQK